jgi:hypothetical protein
MLAPAREKKSNGIQHHQKKHKVCSLDVGESSAFIGEKMLMGLRLPWLLAKSLPYYT